MIYIVNGSIVQSNGVGGTLILNGSLLQLPVESGIDVLIDVPETTISISIDNPIVGIGVSVLMPSTDITLSLEPTILIFSLSDLTTSYKLILTGIEDNTTDLTIPMMSFSCFKGDITNTYVFITTPMLDADDIISRYNGRLIIKMLYKKDGSIIQEEPIIETAFNRLSMYDNFIQIVGKQSYGLYTSAHITLSNYSIHSVENNKHTFTFVEPNIYVKPGDTITVGDTTFIAGNINYSINNVSQDMQIVEA